MGQTSQCGTGHPSSGPVAAAPQPHVAKNAEAGADAQRPRQQSDQAVIQASLDLLKEMLQQHVRRDCSGLWVKMDRSERQLRKVCLEDRLWKRMQDKYLPVLFQNGAKLLAYLRTPQGHAHVVRWLDKKITEVAANWGNTENFL